MTILMYSKYKYTYISSAVKLFLQNFQLLLKKVSYYS